MVVNNVQKYQQNAVMTAGPAELTLMLYNGAIKFCNSALEAMDKKNIEQANTSIIKTQRIIEELQLTLDDKYPITKEIRPLYVYINKLLVDANISKNKQPLIEAKELIVEFRDLWKEVVKQSKQ